MDNNKVEDLDYALSHCGDDMAMLDVVYRLTYLKVTSVCYAVCKDKQLALDYAHDTYLRLISVARRYRRGTNPLAFIMRVAVNVTRERKRRDDNLRGAIELENVTETTTEELGSTLYTDWLLSRLDESKRLITMLYVYSGLTFEEIAKVTGKNVNTVRAEYRSALNILKKEVNTDEKR